MGIILAILKWIGIILLSVLGLLALIILIVLFVPVRYKISASFHEDVPKAKISICYLFSVVWVDAGYKEDVYAYLRIFGIKIMDFIHPKEKKKSKKINEKRNKDNTDEASDELDLDEEPLNEENKDEGSVKEEACENIIADSIESTTKKQQTIDNREKEQETKSNILDNEDNITEATEMAIEEAEADTEEEDETTLLEKIDIFIEFLSEKFDILFNKLASFREKLSGIADKGQATKKRLSQMLRDITYYQKLWERPNTQLVFNKAKATLLKGLKAIKPSKLKLSIHFGMDDPATTGELCGIFGMVYPFIGKYVMIEPDFEQKIIEGDFLLKGRIRVCSFIRVAWLLLFDKNVRRLKKELKRQRK